MLRISYFIYLLTLKYGVMTNVDNNIIKLSSAFFLSGRSRKNLSILFPSQTSLNALCHLNNCVLAIQYERERGRVTCHSKRGALSNHRVYSNKPTQSSTKRLKSWTYFHYLTLLPSLSTGGKQ